MGRKDSNQTNKIFRFSKKMWVIRAEIHNMFVKIVNREDPDQTAEEAVQCGSALFV